jgi:hypothetical protein
MMRPETRARVRAAQAAREVRRLLRAGPRRELHEHVLDLIAEDSPLGGEINARRDELLRRLDAEGLPVGPAEPHEHLASLLLEERGQGGTARRLGVWAQRRGLDWDSVPAAVRDRMAAGLRGQNVNAIPDAELTRRYRHAYKTAGKAPVVLDGRPDCEIFDTASFEVPIGTAPVHLLDEQAVSTVAALAYVHTVGEEIGAFGAADLLLARWADGRATFTGGVLFNDLYCLYKREDVMPEERRFTLYQRVLGIQDDRAAPGTPVNSALTAGWNRLVRSVADYLALFGCESCDEPAILEPVAQATLSLQSVISENLTGLDVMQATDVWLQLESTLQLLDNQEVVAQLAGGRPGGVWAVIPALIEDEGRTAPDVATLHDQALARRDVFAWVAGYDPADGVDPYDTLFQDLLRAVAVLRRVRPPVTGRVLVAVEGTALEDQATS